MVRSLNRKFQGLPPGPFDPCGLFSNSHHQIPHYEAIPNELLLLGWLDTTHAAPRFEDPHPLFNGPRDSQHSRAGICRVADAWIG